MNLNQFFQILKARFWLVIFTLVVTVGTASVVTYNLPRTYTASTELVIDFRSNDPLGTAMLPSQMTTSYMTTQMDILASHRVATKVVDNLKLGDNPTARDQFFGATGGKGSIRDWLANVLLENLEVEPSRDSRIITIHYSSTDPRFAKTVADAFAHAYVETNLELSIEPARQSTTWFDEQLKVLREKVAVAQATMTEYQQEHGIVAADERLDTEMAQLASLSNQLVAVQGQTYDAESRLRQVQSITDLDSLENLPDVLSNSFIQSLKSELLRQQAKLDELSKSFGVNHPQYQRAQAEVDSLRLKLSEEMDSLMVGIKNSATLSRGRQETLQTAVDEQKEKVLELKRQHDEISVLKREVENAQRTYDTALQRFNQISLESQVNQTNIAVLTEAVEPLEPSSPKVMRNIALSVMLGGLLGVGLAFLFEMLDRRVRTESDLKDAIGVPVLGTLAKGVA